MITQLIFKHFKSHLLFLTIFFIIHFSLFTFHCFAQVPLLWGMTAGGASLNKGTIYKINGDSSDFSDIFNFNGTDGSYPRGKLSTYNNDGKLYGFCGGGINGYGLIFSFDTLTNTSTNLYNFTGSNIGDNGNLLLANDNKFYGTTFQGGYGLGNVFSYDPVTNIFTDIHDFVDPNEGQTEGQLMQATNGLIYGWTGGLDHDLPYAGVIFSYNTVTSIYNDVYSFDTLITTSNGTQEQNILLQASNGLLYGMSRIYGAFGNGLIYSFDINTNIIADLYDFNYYNTNSGASPYGSLMQASNGLLYGMANGGGIYGDGVIFSFNPVDSAYTKLFDFNNTLGARPVGSLMQASDGNLYGTASSGGNHNKGVVFKYVIDSNTYIVIHNFIGIDGSNPVGDLIEVRCISHLAISSNTTICAGDSTTLHATGATSFAWQPGSFIDTVISVAPTVTTSYLVTGTLGGCSKTDTIIVTVNPIPSPSITGASSLCSGSSSILDAGSFPFYNWSTGSFLETTTVSSANTYTVTVTDNNGCTGTASQVVSVYSNPTPVITGGTALCSGDSLILNAGSYSQYNWNTNVGTPYITVTASGTYIVTVTDINGCTGTSSQAVSVYSSPNPTIQPNGPTTFCQGGSVILNAGSYSSYHWSNGITTQTINVNASGNYTITVTNSTGCTGIASQTVTVLANPVPTILPASPINLCEGESIQLEASNGILYNWSNGATTQSLTVTQSGAYIVTVTYGVNCSNTSSPTQVTVHPIPIATITAIPDNIEFCTGDSINLITNSTTSPITYLWNTTATTQSIEATTGGTFIVTITDTNNCHSTSSITLTSYLYPVANFTYTMFLNTTTFTNTSTNGMDYQWYFGDGNVSTLMNPIHTYTHDSTYTITLIVSNPCGTDTLRQTITLTGIPSINTCDNILIYPNPANTVLNIHSSFSSRINRDNCKLAITNVLGQEIDRKSVV